MNTLVIGDMHAGHLALRRLFELLDQTEPDSVLQLGDLGWWPDQVTDGFLKPLSDRMVADDIPFYWVDGNHEHHPSLTQDHGVHELLPNLFHMSRGSTVDIGESTILALGGAVSIDKYLRTPGASWFPEEIPTTDQLDAILEQVIPKVRGMGRRLIVAAHDSPAAEVPFVGLPWVSEELNRESAAYRTVLDTLLTHLPKVELWLHAHWHEVATYAWRDVPVIGLANLDGRSPQDAWLMLDQDPMKSDPEAGQ